jgi:GT2 family glycosyltransferase
VANTTNKDAVELVVLDNGSTDGTMAFLERFVLPHFPNRRVIQHAENTGVIPSMNQLVQDSTGEVIALLHNDLYVFERGWNERVVAEFEADPRLGLAGFLGAKAIVQNGGRGGVYSNLLEAEIHGTRETGTQTVVVFDGLALIGRRTMFAQVGGFDTNLTYHHFYDRQLSVDAYLAGWTSKVIGIFCHHRSGVTANRPQYQEWIAQKLGTPVGQGDQASYSASERYFLQQYGPHLPITVA